MGKTVAAPAPASLATLRARVQSLADPAAAAQKMPFFKTAPGQYGAGDQFLGITVPELRKIAKEFRGLALADAAALLDSAWHEERLLALFFLTQLYASGTPTAQREVYDFYIAHRAQVNNWDLVDASAHLIAGPWLEQRDRAVLCEWARSAVLWERRIAVVATFHFIRQGDFTDILKLSELLLTDPHDLMHKATGWMLREVGKRDRAVLEQFLAAHAAKMPRTMLRYAIEKFPEPIRQQYLRAGKNGAA